MIRFPDFGFSESAGNPVHDGPQEIHLVRCQGLGLFNEDIAVLRHQVLHGSGERIVRHFLVREQEYGIGQLLDLRGLTGDRLTDLFDIPLVNLLPECCKPALDIGNPGLKRDWLQVQHFSEPVEGIALF